MVSIIAGDFNQAIDAGLTLAVTHQIGDYAGLMPIGTDSKMILEGGIAGVLVKLYRADNSLVATSLSDSNGAYEFINLPEGMYYLEFITPTGYELTQENVFGLSDLEDSDALRSTGKTAVITLNSGNIMTFHLMLALYCLLELNRQV